MPEFVATNAALSAVQTELAAARDAAQVFKILDPNFIMYLPHVASVGCRT